MVRSETSYLDELVASHKARAPSHSNNSGLRWINADELSFLK